MNIIDKIRHMFGSMPEMPLGAEDIKKMQVEKHKAEILDRLLAWKVPGFTHARSLEYDGAYAPHISMEPFPGYGEHGGMLHFMKNKTVMALGQSKADILDGILFAAKFDDVRFDVPWRISDMLGKEDIEIVHKGTTLEELEIELDLKAS